MKLLEALILDEGIIYNAVGPSYGYIVVEVWMGSIKSSLICLIGVAFPDILKFYKVPLPNYPVEV